MKRFFATRFLKVWPFVVAGILLLTDARPAHATPCFVTLANCYFYAAVQDSFWFQWASGLDCELDFINCVRRDILGR